MPPTDEELLDLAERVGASCRAGNRTLATAESCTGGLVAHLITEIPGSSAYFLGGLVTYDDDGEDGARRRARRASSTPTAPCPPRWPSRWPRAPAAASAWTSRSPSPGIAGPDGGSDTKPVGLTYVGIADADGDDVRRHLWSEDRSGNKRASAAAALSLVLERLAASDT